MERHGWIIGLRPEKAEEYKRLHAAVWPGVLEKIADCGIRNYSIYLREFADGSMYLFSYLEYVGDDFEGDMAKMAADATTQEWWAVCKPCQKPLENRESEDEWWSNLEEVFHCD